MMWIICHFDPEKLSYVIDHYSHNIEDIIVTYEKYYKMYGKECRLLVDERVLSLQEMRVEFTLRNPKFAEIRKQLTNAKLLTSRVDDTL